MISPAIKMTYQQKLEREKFKRKTLLAFLATEIYTTVAVVAELLDTSERSALRLLKKLISENLIKVDVNIVPQSNLKLYGISDHGIAVAGLVQNVKAFEIGRTNPHYVQHHIQCQMVRIHGERAGWTGWIPGKLLYCENSLRLKKLPDFMMTRPDGYKACGELERYCKSARRMTDIVSQHLKQVVAGHYDFIYYFAPDKAAQERAFERVKFIFVDGNKIKINESHLARFKIFEIDSWKGEM